VRSLVISLAGNAALAEGLHGTLRCCLAVLAGKKLLEMLVSQYAPLQSSQCYGCWVQKKTNGPRSAHSVSCHVRELAYGLGQQTVHKDGKMKVQELLVGTCLVTHPMMAARVGRVSALLMIQHFVQS